MTKTPEQLAAEKYPDFKFNGVMGPTSRAKSQEIINLKRESFIAGFAAAREWVKIVDGVSPDLPKIQKTYGLVSIDVWVYSEFDGSYGTGHFQYGNDHRKPCWMEDYSSSHRATHYQILELPLPLPKTEK